MPSFNKTILIGNLTRDPELKFTQSEMAICSAGLACNRKFRTKDGESREEVLFIDITVFGKSAETFNQYMTKGQPVLLDGRLKLDTWEAKDGGGKRSKIHLIVENFQFLGSKDDDQGERVPPKQAVPAGVPPDDGDIPF